ncbi:MULTISPECIES: hypothetical protein [unclassified Sphingobacterium]|uniref:hypothetical protein n=1 Tax=unclassified Sphingobacterium TaxID=2609468 RepID=UPI00104A8D90|nr:MULTISPECIES: hypothetical protein [unclassified Sphingobacterium]MCS3557534.1 hypothetical protein [Sphingobacterium sp. JUb21]TCQ95919.1 hypothetical protein EDF66_12433 [Sphingobacterium sp. JUb20]
MNNYKIFCLDNSELAQYEAYSKGYRSDIYVLLNGEYYHLYFCNIIRLRQDFDCEFKDYGYFSVEPNLILVKEVKLDFIEKTVQMLISDSYFDRIRPVQIPSHHVEQLQDLI